MEIAASQVQSNEVACPSCDLIFDLSGLRDGETARCARLVASWTISDSEESMQLEEHKFVAAERLSGDGYAALVQAEKRLLAGLATSIAEQL